MIQKGSYIYNAPHKQAKAAPQNYCPNFQGSHWQILLLT